MHTYPNPVLLSNALVHSQLFTWLGTHNKKEMKGKSTFYELYETMLIVLSEFSPDSFIVLMESLYVIISSMFTKLYIQ